MMKSCCPLVVRPVLPSLATCAPCWQYSCCCCCVVALQLPWPLSTKGRPRFFEQCMLQGAAAAPHLLNPPKLNTTHLASGTHHFPQSHNLPENPCPLQHSVRLPTSLRCAIWAHPPRFSASVFRALRCTSCLCACMHLCNAPVCWHSGIVAGRAAQLCSCRQLSASRCCQKLTRIQLLTDNRRSASVGIDVAKK